MKLTEKEVREIVGAKSANLPDEQREFIDTLVGSFTDTINKANEGVLDNEALTKALEPLNKQAEAFAEVAKENAELVAQVKSLSEAIDKMKKNGIGVEQANAFKEAFDQMYDSQKFQDFLNNNEKSATGYEFKDISLTSNFNTPYALAKPTDIVVSRVSFNQLHVRDFATVLPGDPTYPVFPFQQIYDVDRNARYVSENGMLPEGSFKVKESSAEVKRVGMYFKLSKRALKCRQYLQGYVFNCLLSGVRDAEDYGILFGNGSGDNLLGITRCDGVKSVEDIISTSVYTVSAGGVKSLTKDDKGNVIVEFAAVNDMLMDGMKITFAGATQNTGLNSTFDVVKLNDKQIMLEKPTIADATKFTTDAPLLTATIKHGAYKSVESPNSIDALETAVAVMTYDRYVPSVLVLNPITLNAIRTEKATDGNRLDVVKDMNGNPIIAGLRVVPSVKIPAGKYFIGDMNKGAQIIDYTPLTAEWKDDVDTALKNQVVLLAQSELILPVFCPWAFSYGSISALKTAITKPGA